MGSQPSFGLKPTSVLLLQIQYGKDKHEELVLNAKFADTIAFYIWNTLKWEQYPDPAALANAWQADALELVQHFSDIFSVGRSAAECAEALEKAYCHIAFTDPPVLLAKPFKPSQGFTAVPDRQELLRYALDKLMLSARKIRRQSEGLPPESTQENDHHTSAAWQASNADSIGSQANSMQMHTNLLQSMLVLWKLAWIAGCVSWTVQTRETHTAISCIMAALAGLCDQLKRYDESAISGVTSFPPQAGTTGAAEAAAKREFERKSLSLMLVMMVRQTLPAVVGAESLEADVCIIIMSALMMRSQPSTYQAVARAIVAKGTVAVTHVHQLPRLGTPTVFDAQQTLRCMLRC